MGIVSPARRGFRLATLTMTMILSGACLFTAACRQENKPPVDTPETVAQTYVTRPILEPDKIASIWLIRRFVDPRAEFRFIPDDLPLTNGIPLDVPEAEFRRYARLSCFESILKRHPVEEPAVARLAAMIHEIEINYWAVPSQPGAAELKQALSEMILKHPGAPEACLPEAFDYLDQTLRRLGAGATNSP